MSNVPLFRGAAAALLVVAWLAVPQPGGAQAAQGVRVPHDSGGAAAAGEDARRRRYGPPESVRQRDAQLEAAVPTRYAPPAGMCRVWVGGVPPARQPAPTDCAKAVRVRSPNSHIVFGKARPAAPEGPIAASPNQTGVSVGGSGDVSTDHGRPGADVHGAPAPLGGTRPPAGTEPSPAAGHAQPSEPAAPVVRARSHPIPPPHSPPPAHVAARPRR